MPDVSNFQRVVFEFIANEYDAECCILSYMYYTYITVVQFSNWCNIIC